MKVLLRSVALALLVLCVSGSATIDGTTNTNCGSGDEPVSGVTVSLSSEAGVIDTQTTNSEGYFAFKDVQTGLQVEVSVEDSSLFYPTSPVSASTSTNVTLAFELIPVLTLIPPSDVSLSCPANTDPSNTGNALVTCYCPVTISFSDYVYGSPCDETVERTWVATMGTGDMSSALQIITVVDVTPPVLTAPPDVYIDCSSSSSPTNTGMATASDACTTATIVFSDSVTGGCPEVVTRTWVATDACGNSASAVQTITMSDTTTPVFTVSPVAYNGTCGTDSADWYQSYAYSVVTDACSPVELSMSMQGSCSGTASVSATDDCGNFVVQTTTFSTQSTNPNDPDDCDSCWF